MGVAGAGMIGTDSAVEGAGEQGSGQAQAIHTDKKQGVVEEGMAKS